MLNHLLFLTPGFPASEADTACLPMIQTLIKEMAAHFPETVVSVVSTQYPYEVGEYRWNGLPVYTAAGKNRRFPLRLKTWYEAKKYILRLHQKTPISLIHSFWLSECALLGHYIGRQLGIPHLNTVMGQDAKKNNPYLNALPLEKMQLVGLSPFHAERFRDSTGKNLLSVVPLGIDTTAFPPLNTAPRPIHLLGVGSLIPLKNYGVFVQAAQKLRLLFPDLRCELAGDGVERERLEKMVENAGLTDHFYFCGQIPREEVLEKMSQSRVLFHPSVYESFGYVFSEGLYSGMQICSRAIGAATPGPRWMVAKDDEDMVNIAKKSLSQPYSPLREKVPTIYDMVQTYRKYYLSLL
ncbi:MAG: glycosyltransferase [Bacteroidia bacterium]